MDSGIWVEEGSPLGSRAVHANSTLFFRLQQCGDTIPGGSGAAGAA